MDRIYLIIRHFTVRWKFDLVKEFIASNALLDVGCGTGDFLKHCKQNGISVYGVEPADAPRRKTMAHQIQVEQSLDKLPGIQFDVITLWHVLEHLYKLEQSIDTIVQKLTKGGTVFIAVPNRESSDAEHYKSLWAAYDVPRHLWHFSKANMKQLLEKSGLRLIKIIPMRLDAYYVSILSEKNKSDGKLGIAALTRAISVAFRSNARAKKDLNYSSLIYVAQK